MYSFFSFNNRLNERLYTESVDRFKTALSIIIKSIFKVEAVDHNEILCLINKGFCTQSIFLLRLEMSLSARSEVCVSLCVQMHTYGHILKISIM